jgi:hypothetical protein
MIEEKRNQKKEKRKLNTQPVYTSLKHSHEIKHYMIKELAIFYCLKETKNKTHTKGA